MFGVYHSPRPYVATVQDSNAPPPPASSYSTFYGGNVAVAVPHPEASSSSWMKWAGLALFGYAVLRFL